MGIVRYCGYLFHFAMVDMFAEYKRTAADVIVGECTRCYDVYRCMVLADVIESQADALGDSGIRKLTSGLEEGKTRYINEFGVEHDAGEKTISALAKKCET